MNTKLTLSIEQTIVEKAKKYAKEQERSLSDLIENYLKALTYDQPTTTTPYTPIVQSLKGAFTPPTGFDFDYKEALSDILAEKYL
jgi:hypothetical protein